MPNLSSLTIYDSFRGTKVSGYEDMCSYCLDNVSQVEQQLKEGRFYHVYSKFRCSTRMGGRI